MDINHKILKMLAGKETQEEFEQLKEWQAEAKGNIEALKEYQDIWEQTEVMENYKDFNKEEGWTEVEKSIQGNTKWLTWSILGVAGFLAALFIYSEYNRNKIPLEFSAADSINTFALHDDSKVWLNDQSELKVISDFSVERVVSLSGEAYFDIERNEEIPFKVALGNDRYVKVLGTEFNIKNDEIFEIFVTEGKVAVYDGSTRIELIAGDAVREVEDSLVKFRMQNDNYLSWKDKRMVFNDAPITSVLETIATTYDKEIKLSEDVINSDCKLRTKFSGESFDDVLGELERIFDLKYKMVDNKIHFYYVKC